VRIGSSGSYTLCRSTLERADSALLSSWQALHDRISPELPTTDPEWVGRFFAAQTRDVSIYSLEQGERLSGVAAFLYVEDWAMKWHLGDWTLARLPLNRLRLIGGEPLWPDDPQAWDLLFRELARNGGYDTLFLEQIPVASALWKYLHESETIRRHFLLYRPDPPAPRLILRVEGTFEQYLRKFSHKHRSELTRRVNRLKDGTLGEMRLVRYETPEEAAEFLRHAVAVSRNTYQWKLHRRGLNDEMGLLEMQLMGYARRGWNRSYILFCGDRPCAFRLGFQYRGRYFSHEIGFDPEFARYSAGTVLQYLTIRDLFEYNRPAVFDLQEYGAYKQTWATESFPEGRLYLFRRSAYARVCCWGDRTCRSANAKLSAFLERMNWKSSLKKWMRGWKQPGAGAQEAKRDGR
jgi:hypothetical protein